MFTHVPNVHEGEKISVRAIPKVETCAMEMEMANGKTMQKVHIMKGKSSSTNKRASAVILVLLINVINEALYIHDRECPF